MSLTSSLLFFTQITKSASYLMEQFRGGKSIAQMMFSGCFCSGPFYGIEAKWKLVRVKLFVSNHHLYLLLINFNHKREIQRLSRDFLVYEQQLLYGNIDS